MKPDVFLDMDGVLSDFVSASIDFYNLGIKHEDVIHWDTLHEIYSAKTGRTKSDFWEDLSVKFWSEMPKTRECDKILALVSEYSPIILTAPPMSEKAIGDCVTGKLMWIKKFIPEYFYSARFMIGARKDRCAHKGAVLIDDNNENCWGWNDKGGSAVLVPRPWNQLAGDNTLLSVQTQFRNILQEED